MLGVAFAISGRMCDSPEQCKISIETDCATLAVFKRGSATHKYTRLPVLSITKKQGSLKARRISSCPAFGLLRVLTSNFLIYQ
jgi:hypothetical protein